MLHACFFHSALAIVRQTKARRTGGATHNGLAWPSSAGELNRPVVLGQYFPSAPHRPVLCCAGTFSTSNPPSLSLIHPSNSSAFFYCHSTSPTIHLTFLVSCLALCLDFLSFFLLSTKRGLFCTTLSFPIFWVLIVVIPCVVSCTRYLSFLLNFRAPCPRCRCRPRPRPRNLPLRPRCFLPSIFWADSTRPTGLDWREFNPHHVMQLHDKPTILPLDF